jgi:hypothetical protein
MGHGPPGPPCAYAPASWPDFRFVYTCNFCLKNLWNFTISFADLAKICALCMWSRLIFFFCIYKPVRQFSSAWRWLRSPQCDYIYKDCNCTNIKESAACDPTFTSSTEASESDVQNEINNPSRCSIGKINRGDKWYNRRIGVRKWTLPLATYISIHQTQRINSYQH